MNEKKIIISVSFLTIIILVAGVWFVGSQGTKEQKKISTSLMGEEIPSQGASHVARGQEHPAYNSNPPTSGWHWGDGVAGPGIKESEVPDELLLHSLEHGATIVHYKADLPQSDIEKIKSAFDAASGKKIMLPRKNLDVPVALTSWGRLLKLSQIDEGKIKEFIETNSDRAPEKAPI